MTDGRSLAAAAPAAPATLERVLGRGDLVLFTVCAILTIDTLATSAAMGVAWFSWWLITMTVFFIPYGFITAELGAAWPGEGGVYVWVREAFGPRWGSQAAWMYWINNATWLPSVYLIFAGTFEQIFLKRHSTWQEAGIAIALTWMTVVIGIVRLEVSKWVPNLGAFVKALIFLALGLLGLSVLLRGRPQSSKARPEASFAFRSTPQRSAATIHHLNHVNISSTPFRDAHGILHRRFGFRRAVNGYDDE